MQHYQEVTRTFTDVFKVPNHQVKVDTSKIPNDQHYNGIELSDVKFDFETLYDLLLIPSKNHSVYSLLKYLASILIIDRHL